MNGKTKLEYFIEHQHTFFYNEKMYIIEDINDILKGIIVNINESILKSTWTFIGIYNMQKHEIVLNNNTYKELLYIIDKDFSRTLNELKTELSNSIKTEFDIIAKYTSVRTKLNDKSNQEYMNRVRKEAIDRYMKGSKIRTNIVIDGFDFNNFNEKILLKSLEDMDNTVCDVVDEFIKTHQDYLQTYYFKLDVAEIIEELNSNPQNQYAALAKIQEISKNENIHRLTVEVDQFNNGEDSIEYNKILKINPIELKNIPIEVIKKVLWRRQELYNRNNYNVKSDISNWINTISVAEYSIDCFVPDKYRNDIKFWKEVTDKRNINEDMIPDDLLKNKDTILELLNMKLSRFSIYLRLDKKLQLDTDIMKLGITNKPIISMLPNYVLDNKFFQSYGIEHFNLRTLNDMVDFHHFDFNNQILVDGLMEKIKKEKFMSYYDDEIISHITDIDIIIHLLQTDSLHYDQLKYLNDSIINNDKFWDNIHVESFIGLELADYSRLNKNIINNDDYLVKIFNLFVDRPINLIKNTIGEVEFKKRRNFQKKLITKNIKFIEFVDADIIEEYVLDNVRNKEFVNYNQIFRNNNLNADELIEKIMDINITELTDILNTITYCNNYKLSIKTFKKIFKKNPNCIDYIPSCYYYYHRKVALLASNYKSIISKINQIPNLSRDKDIIYNSLQQDYSTFCEIQRPYANNNYLSVFRDTDFVKKIFSIKKNDNMTRNAIDYLKNSINTKDLLNDEELVKIILINNFGCIDCFKRSVYNNKELILDILKNTNANKNYILNSLKNVKSKLVKDTDILSILS